MSYIEKNALAPNEKIILSVKKNPISLILAWVWGILGFWLLLMPLLNAISATIAFITTEYAISDKHVYEKRGWLKTHCDEMTLDHIENITSNQSFFGKIFNYGNVCIQGANRNNVNFKQVCNPQDVRKTLNELKSVQ